MGLQIDDLVVESTLSASTMTATTLYVGTNSIGSSNSSFDTLSATTFSAGTLYSGSTNLYSIFLTTNDGNDITRVQPGSNTTTGGTGNNPTVNLVASPSINGLSFSGTANGLALSATTLSGGTILSGSTNLYSIFLTSGSLTPTYVQNGLNTYTAGTISNPTVNVSALTINTITVSGSSNFNAGLSASTLSGGTILSGSTNLYSIFATLPDQNDITRVQPGTNITTGGTANNPTVNLVASPSVNSITASGSSIFSAGLSATTFSANTINVSGQLTGADGATFANLSGTNIFSGSANLGTLFIPTGGTLRTKSGSVSGSTFAGNPKKATVTFATAFANTNYAITILSDTNRTWTWESKAAGSFVINANSNTGFASGNVDWIAIQNGEK